MLTGSQGGGSVVSRVCPGGVTGLPHREQGPRQRVTRCAGRLLGSQLCAPGWGPTRVREGFEHLHLPRHRSPRLPPCPHHVKIQDAHPRHSLAGTALPQLGAVHQAPGSPGVKPAPGHIPYGVITTSPCCTLFSEMTSAPSSKTDGRLSSEVTCWGPGQGSAWAGRGAGTRCDMETS